MGASHPTTHPAGEGGAASVYLLAAVGCAIFLLEVLATRLLAFKAHAFQVHAACALALLGFAGGALFSARRHRRAVGGVQRPISAALVWTALSSLAALALLHFIPFDTAAFLESHFQTFWWASALLVLGSATFGLGVAAALALRSGGGVAGPYAGFFAGSALAAVLATPLLAVAGPSRGFGILVLGTGALAALWAGGRETRLRRLAIVVALAGLLPIVRPERLPELRIDIFGKQLYGGGSVTASAWTAKQRIDRSEAIAWNQKYLRLHQDGSLHSEMRAFDGTPAGLATWRQGLSALPHQIGLPRNAPVGLFGAAGQSEILTARSFGVRDIRIVEQEAQLRRLIDEQLGSPAGVRWIEGGPWGLLAPGEKAFGLIQLVIPAGNSLFDPATLGGPASEEGIWLSRALLGAAFDRLGQRGLLVLRINDWQYREAPFRGTRAVRTLRAVLDERGIRPAGAHFLVASQRLEAEETLILVRAAPFSDAERQRFIDAVGHLTGGSLRYAAGLTFDDGPLIEAILSPTPDAPPRNEPHAPIYRVIEADAPLAWTYWRTEFGFRGLSNFLDILHAGIGSVMLLVLGAALGGLALLATLACALGGPLRGFAALRIAAAGAGIGLASAALAPWLASHWGNAFSGVRLGAACLQAGAALALWIFARRPEAHGVLRILALIAGLLAAGYAGRAGIEAPPWREGSAGFALGVALAVALARSADPPAGRALGFGLFFLAVLAGRVLAGVVALAADYEAALDLALVLGAFALTAQRITPVDSASSAAPSTAA